MKRFVSISLAIVLCFCMLIATERQAFAYVDPGSGMLALQSIASVMAASVYFLRRRIRLLFARSASQPKGTLAAKDNSADAA